MSRKSTTLYVRTTKHRKKEASHPSIALLVIVLMVVGGVLVIALGKVYLERRAFQAGLQWEATTNELNETLKENDNLRVERERLTSGDYILPQARRMGLRPPLPGQIRRVWPVSGEDEIVARSVQ